MSSTVTYYRPKGVPGIFAVQVTLDLQPSQWAKVDIGRYRDRGYHCGSCGHQQPISPLQTETQRIERYAEFRDIWERDTITIEIHERELGEEGPCQIVVFTASHTGIQAQSLPCKRHGRTWHQDELKFNDIALIDAGTSPHIALTQVIEERAHRVEAKEIKSSAQSESGVYRARNGFVATGLLAIPVAGQVSRQQMLIPVFPGKTPDRVAILN